MGRKWSAAVQEIKSPELERWVRRSLSDDRRAAAVSAATQAVIGVSGGVAGLDDRLLTRVLIALDHQAPLRYKQIAVRIQGFAAAFAVNCHHDDPPPTFAEMTLHKPPPLWIAPPGKLPAASLAPCATPALAAPPLPHPPTP